MEAILKSIKRKKIPINPAIVISNNPNSKGLMIAQSLGVKTEIIAGINFSLERDLELIEKEKLIYNKNLQKIIKLIEKLFSIKPTVEEFSVEMRKIYIESLKKKTLILKKIEDIKMNEIYLLSEIEDVSLLIIRFSLLI